MNARRVHDILRFLLIFTLLLGGLAPSAALAKTATDEPPPAHGLRPDAPAYAIDGPYGVGVRDFEIAATADNQRPLTVSVWYPALIPPGVEASVTYTMGFPAGETPNVPVYGHAVRNAAAAIDGGPYPLVVHTHAHWSFRQETPYLDEHLASMGFVVIAADHEDNWSTLFGPNLWPIEFQRPNEVTREIDYAESLTAQGPLAGLIDTEHVGVIGWSGGGETALVGGGARLDLSSLRAWCEANTVNGEPPDTDCTDILDHEAEIAALAGLDSVPTGLWPDWSDKRIDAVIALAPWIGALGSTGLQSVTVPTLFMIGSGDTSAVNPLYRDLQPYQRIQSERKAEVVFENAEHLLFFSACREIPDVVDLGLHVFCSDPVWDMDRAHDLVNHFATAFFLAELTGDETAGAALASDQVSFYGIEYRETGYGKAAQVPPATPQGFRPDAPSFGVHGPYSVGVRDFVIESPTAGERPIPVSIWYPALNPGGLPESTTYMLNFGNPTFPDFAITGHALRNAEPDGTGGPYPLVVYSHGMTLFRQASSYLLEHLASWGFVVIAGDHKDNWGGLMGELPRDNFVVRAQEITREIDFSATLGAADGTLAGMIDMEKVGVTGHSFGAETALLMGGARLNTNTFLDEWCASNPVDVLNDCGAMPTRLEKMAKMAGLASVPNGLWPDWSDPRVDAVVSLASGPQVFGAEGLKTLHTPILWVEGGLDWYAGAASAYYKPYNRLPGNTKAHLVFPEGDHALYLNSCDVVPGLVQQGFGSFCMDPVWDMDRAHDLVNHFATAFLLAELKGDAEATTALAPENVAFPGIEYQADGYTPATEAASLDAETSAQIDAMVEETMARINLPGFALAVVKDGELVYAKGFGVTSLDGGTPVTPQTIFQWAETSMAPTAMAVLQLVEQGKLDLDAPVTDYLPYFRMDDEHAGEITVGQLLLHSSGIPDSGDTMADWENFMPEYDAGALERWVRNDLAEKGLLFAPGTGFEYSDLGYALLGAVISAASGQPYEEYMSQHILAPLGMDQSTFLLEEVDKALLASPHVADATGAVVASKKMPYHRPFAATNNLFSNIEDMAKLAQVSLNRGVLNDQRILSESAFEQMWTPHSPTPYGDFPFGRLHPSPMMIDWGYGWFLGDVAGHLAPNTFGREYGYHASTAFAPDANLAVIAVGNGPVLDEYYAADMATDVMGMLLLDDATVAKIDGIVQQAMTDYPPPGFEMCVVKDGQVVYNKGFGLADVEGNRPMTPQTVSVQDSLSKSMTAMAVMQLVEQGKVELDAPVTTYLPYFKMADARYQKITVRMLLNHTAGVPDDAWGFALTGDMDPMEQAVRSLADKQLLNAPGAEWFYSNPGYVVLGALIAKVSGESFASYMQEHLLKPMGMLHSTFVPDEIDPALRTQSYVDAEGGGIKVGGRVFDARDLPAAFLYSNCEDMAKWATVMLNRGKVGEISVLTPESIDAMWADGVATIWPDIVGPWYGGVVQTYGLGWYMGTMDGHRLVGNAGADDGSNVQIQFAPDDGLAVIAMDNWLVWDTATWYPASFAAVDVLYTLLGIEQPK